MRTLSEAYKKVYIKESLNETPEHESKMKELAIEIGSIGQRVTMGRVRESDGKRLVEIAKFIEKEYIKDLNKI
jgi:hypothetical protein